MINHLWRQLWNWNPLYWLRCHTFTRYHIVDCRTPDYRWGWMDRSELMLYANFAVLCDFMENEFPGMVDWDYGPEIRHVAREMNLLYNWWKGGRQQESQAIHKIFLDNCQPYFNHGLQSKWTSEEVHQKWLQASNWLDERDNIMLHRLINIRGYLWT